MTAFAELLEVMARLRAECAWTREQTHTSLRSYVIEEAYEVADAIEGGDSAELVAELGDLLLQVIFHAAIAESDGEGWTFQDVARTLADKLVRRNPHVFAGGDDLDAAAVDAQWQAIKATEPAKADAWDGIASDLPALMLAAEVLRRRAEPVTGEGPGADLLRMVARAESEGLDLEAELRSAARVHLVGGEPS